MADQSESMWQTQNLRQTEQEDTNKGQTETTEDLMMDLKSAEEVVDNMAIVIGNEEDF